MKAFLLLPFAVLFFTASVSGQGVNKGKPVMFDGQIGNLDLWTTDENGFITRHVYKNDEVFVKHDLGSLNDVGHVSVNLDKDGSSKDGFKFWTTRTYKGEMLVFATYVNKKSMKKELYVLPIDLATMKIKNGFEKILEAPSDKEHGNGFFFLNTSPDGSKCLIIANPGQDPETNKQMHLYVFDGEMKLLWDRPYTTSAEAGLSYHNYRYVTNEGDVHLLGRVYYDKIKESAKGKPNFHIGVHSIVNNGKAAKESRFTMEKYMRDMFITLDGNTITAQGYYNVDASDNSDGLYSLVFDLDKGAVTKTTYHQFSSNLIPEGDKDRISDLIMRRILKFEDGSMLLIGEQYKVVAGQSTPTNGVMAYKYTVQDLIFHHLNPDMTLRKAWRYEKRQKSSDDNGRFLSFTGFMQDNKAILLLNEMNANGSKGAEDRTFHGGLVGNSSVAMLVIDEQSNQTKSILTDDLVMSQSFGRYYEGHYYFVEIIDKGYQLLSKKVQL